MSLNNGAPVLSFLLIFIDIYILVSLIQLHRDTSKCPCAITYHSKKLILVGLVTLVSKILKLLYRDIINKTIVKKNGYILVPLALDLCLSIYYIYLLVKYAMTLKESKCNCLGPVQDVLHYYSNAILFVTFLTAFLVILSLITLLVIKLKN
jgi:hypothetical protein